MPCKPFHLPLCPAYGRAASPRRLAALLGMSLVLAVPGFFQPGPVQAAPAEPVGRPAVSAGQAAKSDLPKEAREEAARYRKAANAGNAEAQYKLGMVYILHDKAQAAKWLRKSAAQGHVYACRNLGTLYYMGEGVPQDRAEAAVWLRKAAEQGDVPSCMALSSMYANGIGVPLDKAQAAKWCRKAADQNDGTAQYAMSLIYEAGEGLPQDRKKALEWLLKAAENRNADAMLALSRRYAEGDGLPRDRNKAQEWLNRAAAYGQPTAQHELGLRPSPDEDGK